MKCKYKHCGEYQDKESMIQTPRGRFCNYEHAAFYAIDKSKSKPRKPIKQKSPGVSSKRKVNQDDYGHQFRLTKSIIQRWVVHVRDKDLPCISCGTESKTIVYAGGHLRSAGGHPELALNSHNIHKQCNFYCNCNLSGNLHGHKTSTGYIKGLIERHGQEYYDRLFEHREQPKITIDQLKEIRAFYSKLIREESKDDSKCPYIVR